MREARVGHLGTAFKTLGLSTAQCTQFYTAGLQESSPEEPQKCADALGVRGFTTYYNVSEKKTAIRVTNNVSMYTEEMAAVLYTTRCLKSER